MYGLSASLALQRVNKHAPQRAECSDGIFSATVLYPKIQRLIIPLAFFTIHFFSFSTPFEYFQSHCGIRGRNLITAIECRWTTLSSCLGNGKIQFLHTHVDTITSMLFAITLIADDQLVIDQNFKVDIVSSHNHLHSKSL